jgi:hypothetical protein
MMLLTAACICLLLCGTAHSGELLNRYNQDLQKLQAEQAKDPNRIIKFSDASGPLAKDVLNIDRVTSVVSEIRSEINQLNTLGALLRGIGPVISKYEEAFNELGEPYEKEYLAAVRVALFLFNATADALNRRLDPTKVTDPDALKMLRGLKTVTDGARNIMTKNLSEVVKSGKLSKDGAATANQMVEAFSRYEANQGDPKKVDSK